MAFGDPKARFEISAEDKTRRAFRSANSNLKKFESGVFNLNRALGALAGAAAVTGIVKLGNDALRTADQIGKVADRVGFSTTALQQFRFAADQTGVATNTVDMALQRFSRRVGEAAKGTGEAKDTLKDLDIQLVNTDGTLRDNEEILFDVADALENTEDKQEQLRIAFKLFDSEGAALINTLRDGSDGLKAYADRANELGIVIDEELIRGAEQARSDLDLLGDVISAKVTRAFVQLAPQISAVAEAFVDLIEWVAHFLNQWKTVNELSLMGVRTEIKAVEEENQALVAGLQRLRDEIKQNTPAINQNREQFERLNTQLTENIKHLDTLRAREQELKEASDKVNESLNFQAEGLGTVGDAAKDAEDDVVDLTAGFKEMKAAMEDSARFQDAVVIPTNERMELVFRDTEKAAKEAGIEIKQVVDSETARIWENTIESMQDAWVTFWEDALIEGSISSFDDFAEELYQIFLKMIARMVAAWTTAWTTDMLGITENAFAGLKIPGIGGGTIPVPGGTNVLGIGLPSASTLAPGPTAGAPGFIGPTAASSVTAAFGGSALTAAAFAPFAAGLADVLTAGPTGPERAAREFNAAFGQSPRFGLGSGAEVAAIGPSGTFVGGFAPNSREMNALAEVVDQLDDGVSNLSVTILAAADDVTLIGASAEQVGQAWNEVVANDFRAGFDLINQSIEKTTVKLRGDTESWRTLLDEAVAKGAIESFTIMEDEAGQAFARISGDAEDATRVMMDAMTSAGLSVEQTMQLIAEEGELSFEQIRVASELARNGVAIDSAIMRDALAEVERQANESADAIARMQGTHGGSPARGGPAPAASDDPFSGGVTSPGGAGFRGGGGAEFRAGRGFQHGGTVGGFGGTDSEAVTVMATPGERVDFNTQTQIEATRRATEALHSEVRRMSSRIDKNSRALETIVQRMRRKVA